MPTEIAYTAEQARRDFPQRMRRSQVMELGRRFGFGKRMLRILMEAPKDEEGNPTGKPAALVGIVYPNTTWNYYDRETVMEVLRV